METTYEELRRLQNQPLERKVIMSRQRIREWVSRYGIDGVYVSFSGGKDSVTLLDIVRTDYKEVKAVYIDTGLEHPTVRKIALEEENCEIVKPKMNFKEILTKYGYPMISKQQSEYIDEYKRAKSEKVKQIRLNGNSKGFGKIRPEYLFMLSAPFRVSDYCCDYMKKHPAEDYEKKTGRHPILGIMAEESRERKSNWMKYGCNAFEITRPKSNPLSFWTENDILKYIKVNNLRIADTYGEIIPKNKIGGQMTIGDILGDIEEEEYTTTGAKRTGCIFCGFGLRHEKDKYIRLYSELPKMIDFVMRGGSFVNGEWKPSNEGLGYWFVLLYMNIHGGMKIEIPNLDAYKIYETEETKKYVRI